MAINPASLTFVCELAHRRSGLVLGPDKAYLLEARLAPLVQAGGYGSLDALVAAVRDGDRELATKVVEALATHETSFFRDVHPFNALASSVLPTLRAARAATRSLTILSAACSSGQEPYSVAMVVSDSFPELSSWTLRIIGVDMSEPVLARARAGRFQDFEVTRGVPPALRARHYDPVDGEWQIKPRVRALVEFRQMNLIDAWNRIPSVDVLLMRNVLIYFDVPTKRAILARARQALAPDGYLLLGGAETTLGIDDAYEQAPVDRTIFYRPAGARRS